MEFLNVPLKSIFELLKAVDMLISFQGPLRTIEV
jgi:hypothetical protein